MQDPLTGLTEVTVKAGMFALEPDAIDPELDEPAPVLEPGVEPVEEPVEEPGVLEPGVLEPGVEPVLLPVELDPAPGLYDVLPVPPEIVPVTSTRCPTYCLRFSLPPVSLYVFPAIRPAPDVPVPDGFAPVADPVEEPVAEPVVEGDDVLPAPDAELGETFVRM